jgi:hypothetical protein
MFLNCHPIPPALKTNVNSAEAAGGTVEQTHTREKPMCAGHNHGGAVERGCDNDEYVEIPRHEITAPTTARTTPNYRPRAGTAPAQRAHPSTNTHLREISALSL